MRERREPRMVTPLPRAPALARIGLALALLAIPVSAAAQPASSLGSPIAREPASSPVRVELLIGSTAPLDVSIAARLVVVDRVILSVSVGASAYGELYGAIAEAYGGEVAGDLARSLGDGLLVGRLGAGVRPFDDLGLELVAGYTVLQRSATLAGSDATALLGTQASERTIRGDLLVHAVHGELAWTFFVLDHLVIRPAIGWTHAVGSSASLSADGASAEESARLEVAARAVEDAIETWGFTPTGSLAIGYRFRESSRLTPRSPSAPGPS